jgi:hypothetical protein
MPSFGTAGGRVGGEVLGVAHGDLEGVVVGVERADDGGEPGVDAEVREVGGVLPYVVDEVVDDHGVVEHGVVARDREFMTREQRVDLQRGARDGDQDALPRLGRGVGAEGRDRQ